MNVRDGIKRIKIWFKKLTGEFEKEKEEKRLAERTKDLEMIYEGIKDIPLTEWSLIINEPDPFIARERYEANRKLLLYRLFDDGSRESLKEYKYSLRTNIGSIGVVFQADNIGQFQNICGALYYKIGEAELKKEDIVLNTKIPLFGEEFADFVKRGQDVFVRDDVVGKVIGFFEELKGHLIPVKESDFLAGQRPLPLVLKKTLSPA